MKRSFTLIALACIFAFSNAQFTISGRITDNESKPLTGANVVIKSTFRGTTTNSEGFFSLKNLKSGNYDLEISYIGYQDITKSVQVTSDSIIEISLSPKIHLTDEVIVLGTRADNKTPTSFSNIKKDEIESKNMGQDLPLILNQSVSVVASTDAGNGIGYTGMRIRGTDINRINVTINGIPFNDSESHGVYWVDIPDFSSSTDNIQIQRGVGTSTNGAASFGGTINLQSNKLNVEPFVQTDLAYGSFNTLKTNLAFGTGLIKNKFNLDGRVSRISSDGFIDRAWSDLRSFYISGGYYTGKNIIKINVFSGLEETYQAWNGVPKVRLKNDIEGMLRYEEHGLYSQEETQNMINSASRKYNLYTYDNQIDHYQQSHYQLHFSRQINTGILFNTAFHYTKGSGYYEEYKEDEDLADYEIQTGVDSIIYSDIIRQKWLDNDFYGVTANMTVSKKLAKFTFGGSWNNYTGNHFGKVIWAQYAGDNSIDHEWYRGKGLKGDFNIYGKLNYQLSEKLNIYTDLQYRGIRYTIKGIDADRRDISRNNLNFDFFNPKTGIYFAINESHKVYMSFAIANREPNRSNYTDAPAGKDPLPERLYDFESGFEISKNSFRAGINFYYMYYKDQLVLTGEINDVGSPIMVNVPRSYRTGIEMVSGVRISKKVSLEGNLTFSRNKILNFVEHIDNWDYWNDPENEPYQISDTTGTTDISFSPSVIGSGTLSYNPFDNLHISFLSKYVGNQFIDNTSTKDRSLDSYFICDVLINYNLKSLRFAKVDFRFFINNILNIQYETNAWVYRYRTGNEYHTMDGYFPQAGTNIVAALSVKI